MKKVIVDIDNTLWYFAPVLYEKLRNINPNFPYIEEWNEYDFWRDHVDKKSFYKCVNEIHMNQDKYGVYNDAKKFIHFLKNELNLHIIIASHRIEASRSATVKWLNKHGIIYDELHLSNDKTKLFDDMSIVRICDDAPDVINKALEKNIKVCGLRHPWNKQYHDILYESLMDIINLNIR